MLIFNVYSSIILKKNYIRIKITFISKLCSAFHIIRISHARTLWMNQKIIHTLLVLTLLVTFRLSSHNHLQTVVFPQFFSIEGNDIFSRDMVLTTYPEYRSTSNIKQFEKSSQSLCITNYYCFVFDIVLLFKLYVFKTRSSPGLQRILYLFLVLKAADMFNIRFIFRLERNLDFAGNVSIIIA